MLAALSGGGWAPLAFSFDEQQLVIGNFVSVNDVRLFVVNVATGALAPLSPAASGATEAWGNTVRFSADGKFIFATTDAGGEFLQLVRVELATGSRTVLTGHLRADVEAFDLAPNGAFAVVVTNEQGRSVTRVLELARRKERLLPNAPAGVVVDVRLHRNGRDLALGVSSNRGGTDVHVVDVLTGKAERWTKSEMGGFDTSAWSEGQLVEWKSFDDRMISGFLFSPPPRFTGKRPVVVLIHGGPEGQSRPDALGKWNQVVEEFGVALIKPNVRGSTGFGKTFSQLDDGLRREGSYQDIFALLEWIKGRSDLDPDRVLVAGGSYGGFMTLAVAANYADRIRCAIDVVGPSNLVTFLENTSGYRRDLRRVEYGDERDPKTREFLERIAPSKKSAAIRRPLFVIQGANDPRVPASESEQMVAAVRKNKTPVWYLLAKDEGHGFQKQPNIEFAFWAQLLFIQSFLLDAPQP